MRISKKGDIKDSYPNAHAMVLGSLMGYGDDALTTLMDIGS